jgi:hypothetical protein
MPFDENKFRVSIETGGIDTVNELGLPKFLNVIGTVAWIDGEDPLPAVMKDQKIKEMFDEQMCLYIDYPAGPEEARHAVTNCIWANECLEGRYVNDTEAFVNELMDIVEENQWIDIGRSIALYKEVFDSVRKPFNSKWSKKEFRVNGKDKVAWVNRKLGVDPKIPAHVYEHSSWVDARLAVGLPVDYERWKLCSAAMLRWKTKTQQLESAHRVTGRINTGSPLFQELMNAACHPKRYFRNCVGEDEFDS